MKLAPVGPRIVVAEPPAAEDRSRFGLIVPESANVESLLRGVVVAANDAFFTGGTEIAVGSVVHYARGRRIGEEYVVDLTDVWAVEED